MTMHQRKSCDMQSNLPTPYELEVLDCIETEPCDFIVDSDFQDIYSVADDDLYRSMLTNTSRLLQDTPECDIQSDFEEFEINAEKMQQDLLEELVQIIPKTFIPCGHSELDVVRGATQYIMCLSTILLETSSSHDLENNEGYFYHIQEPNEEMISNPCSHHGFYDISQLEINASCCEHPNRYPNYNTPTFTENYYSKNSYTSLKSSKPSFYLPSPPLPAFSNLFEKFAYSYRHGQNPVSTSHNSAISSNNVEGFMSQTFCGLPQSSSLTTNPFFHKENMLPCCAVASVYDSYKKQSESLSYDYPVLTSILANQNACGAERKKRPRKRKANRNTGKEITKITTGECLIRNKENGIDESCRSEDKSNKVASSSIFDIDVRSIDDFETKVINSGVSYTASRNSDEDTITTPSENKENRPEFIDGNNNETKADDAASAVQHEKVDSTTDVVENEADVDHFVSEKDLKRPKNGFIRFSVEYRKNLSANQPKMDNREVSRMLGAKWRKMSDEERRPYEEGFQNDIKEIRNKHPEWKYGPTKKPYHELIEPMPSRLRPREKLKRKFKPFIKRTLKKTEYTKRTKPKTELLPVTSHHQQYDCLLQDLTDQFSMDIGYHYTWMQCALCLKHRRVSVTDDNRNQPIWTCHMNPDERYNSCSKEEEICPTIPVASKPEISQCQQQQPLIDYNNNNLNIGRFCTSGHFLYNVPTWSSIKHMY